ncbi:nuclear polyadenylated RNA-binding protein 3 [Friedmanniomyces endolithicus]|nr:nuclear polyadenylated RNA-binding protein 3 [Friedmanniomyces endolithicus]
MNFDHTSPPPEEPLHQSAHTPLSPASPKPLHFPTPTNLPVLEMQTDVDFNQTEPHMADPAMRNTEMRPNLWRDPNEPEEAEAYASPYSTGGEAASTVLDELLRDDEPNQTEEAASSTDMTANAAGHSGAVQLSNDASHQANSIVQLSSASEAAALDALHPSSDPSILAVVPTAQSDQQVVGAQFEQAQPTSALPFDAHTDVQALLSTYQVPQSASGSVTNGVTPPSPSQALPLAPGHDAAPLFATAAGLGAPPSGLPPRPPPQEQPLINPNYVHSQHIRDYHPHAAHSAFQPQQQPNGAQGNVADPGSRNYVPPVPSPILPTSAAASQAQAPTYSYSPSTSTFPQAGGPHAQAQTPVAAVSNYTYSAQRDLSAANSVASGTPIESRREHKLAAGEVPTVDDRPWDAETQAKYDHFIETERHFVSEGRWEQFPNGSRLFVGTRNLDGSKTRKDEVTLVDDDADRAVAAVEGRFADGAFSALGNLSSEKVTKRDIFHVFWRYGDLAQISIKQAYGFVQFLSAEECKRAMEVEQGKQIRDKRIHLEISKPQKNRIPAQNQNQGRRSRSPDYARGGKPAAGTDRYVSNGRNQGRAGTSGYRQRSPSPPQRGYRDRFDERYRERSPPFSRAADRGSRYRSPSPPPRHSEDDDLPLPRRAPRDVPDVQIIVLDSLEREFITWVEQAFVPRGVRVDVLLLSPRLSEQAVIRRQIVEGVVAVVKLGKGNQSSGRIRLQVFDRRGGVGSVGFEEYEGLEPGVVVELVLRAKQQMSATTSAPAPAAQQAYGGGYAAQQQQQSRYGAPQQQQYPGGGYAQAPSSNYGHPQAPTPTGYPPSSYPPPQQPAQPQPPPNLQNLITSLDPSGLQTLLSAMGSHQQQQQQQQQQSPAYAGTPQSAGGSYPQQQQQHQQQQQQHQQQHQQQQAAAMAALQRNPQIAAGLQEGLAGRGGGGQGGGQGAQGNGGQGGQVNMRDLLAKLGSYGK